MGKTEQNLTLFEQKLTNLSYIKPKIEQKWTKLNINELKLNITEQKRTKLSNIKLKIEQKWTKYWQKLSRNDKNWPKLIQKFSKNKEKTK